MKTITIDYSTWRCGGYSESSENKHGKGLTCLRNGQGFMCCLGQASLQMHPNIKEDDILNTTVPNYCAAIPLGPLIKELDSGRRINSDLTRSAMQINDNERTTVKEKIRLLTQIFLQHKFKLKFINVPNTN